MREEVGLWYSLVWKRARAAAFDFVVSQEVRDQKRERRWREGEEKDSN
jgi:hypothetical protein